MGWNIDDDEGKEKKNRRKERENIRKDLKKDKRFVVMGGKDGGDGFEEFFKDWIKDKKRE